MAASPVPAVGAIGENADATLTGSQPGSKRLEKGSRAGWGTRVRRQPDMHGFLSVSLVVISTNGLAVGVDPGLYLTDLPSIFILPAGTGIVRSLVHGKILRACDTDHPKA